MRARRILFALLATGVLWSAPAGGHPGHAPGQVVIADGKFTPQKLRVARHDTVIWFWQGPDTNHSVTSDSGQDVRFDSDAGTPGPLVRHEKDDAYSRAFHELGTHRYHCKVHASMRGTIEVIKAPPKDVKRPRISDLRISPARASRTAKARFRISEAGFVVVSIRREGSNRELESASRFVRKGDRGVRFGVRKLAPGRYRARVVAEDNAANRSRAKSAAFRVVRG
jgi:plastocyanin